MNALIEERENELPVKTVEEASLVHYELKPISLPEEVTGKCHPPDCDQLPFANGTKGEAEPNDSDDFERTWEFTGYQNRVNPNSGKMLFSIMSYNLLSPVLMRRRVDLLHGCPPRTLLWQFRGPKIAREIYEANADILCLQELELDCTELFKHFSLLGYVGIVKRRNSVDTDGVAIYFKPRLFKMVEYITADYVDPILGTVNCGLIIKLALNTSVGERYLVVATAHLPPGGDASPVKAHHVELLISEVERFSIAGRHPVTGATIFSPVLLAGDLNCEPFSGLYRLLTMGQMPRNLAGPRRKLLDPPRCFRIDGPVRGVQEPALLPFLPGDHWQVLKLVRPLALQRHELIFRSVYQHGRSGTDQSECTKVGIGLCTADYILYSVDCGGNTGALELVARFRLPIKAHAWRLGALPNQQHPSDHFPLLANFAIEF